MTTYIFFRAAGDWYAVELEDDQDAKRNAEIKGDITRVETVDGRVIWKDNNRLG